MRLFRPLPLLLAALLTGCAEGPFVDMPLSQSVEKPADPVVKSGEVDICYNSDTPWAEVEGLAGEACAKHGFQARLHQKLPWQCRATAPHRASFACVLPADMATEERRTRVGGSLPRATAVPPGPSAPAIPAPVPPAAPSDFTLEPGSWGQHFKE